MKKIRKTVTYKNVHQRETKNKNPENYFEKDGMCDAVKFIHDFPALFTKKMRTFLNTYY